MIDGFYSVIGGSGFLIIMGWGIIKVNLDLELELIVILELGFYWNNDYVNIFIIGYLI